MDDPLSVFQELGDPTRLRVLACIAGGRKNVSMIVAELGLSQPQVSYHLRRLKDAGLAVEEREGRWVWYQANHDASQRHLREVIDYVSRWAPETGDAPGDRPGAPRERRGPGAASGDDMEDYLL